MASSQHVRIELAPKAGFCVKSSALTPGVLPAPPVPKTSPNLLEPNAPITVPKGLKVFVNIAWDSKVPPPPEGSEEEILRAMQGEEVGETNPSGWYVPVIVSNGREDKDKAGNPSIVFDCIYNTSVKSRTLRDPEFKVFLVELALQRIEAQTGLSLSRNIGTPNIVSKGKLLPRTVQIPVSLLHLSGRGGAATSSSVPARSSRAGAGGSGGAGPGVISSSSLGTSGSSSSKSPLIQEIPPSGPSSTRSSVPDAPSNSNAPAATAAPSKPKAGGSLPGLRGILKNTGAATSNATPAKTSFTPSTSSPAQTSTPKSNFVPNQPASSPASELTTTSDDGGAAAPLDWSWTKDDTDRLRIEVRVPGLTHALVESSTLDVEPRRFTLLISPTPSFPRRTVDVDLSLSDADILSRLPSSQSKTSRVLELKRERDFDVDGARAEWVVGSGVVKIWV